MNRKVLSQVDRRRWMQYATLGAVGACASPWTHTIAAAANAAQPGRHCVLLWMSGGPSQIDTFDMKPNHANGGTIHVRRK